ncbi:MAG: GatB/YqeY domain-containing protein [Alphaproteobacteria bacterium]|nr:GatB/YqeY domain-containing protein [Pseudomonadota bacterium]TDI64843.1 MAG: GatB/YqeY domain-containing protein [Alphaproteobacteria bacterium]
MLRQEISEALKTAMKAKDRRATSTLRLILAALKDREIAARGEGDDDSPIADDAILDMLQKMIRQRHDSIAYFEKGNRPDLVAQESEEIVIINRFLPKQMDEAEITQAIGAVVEELGATTIKDMGRIMGALKERYAGRMDFAKAAQRAKVRLGG